MEGGKDPFNRRTYPWGREDRQLQAHFCTLGQLRKNHPSLRTGDTQLLQAGEGQFAFRRSTETESVRIYVNRSEKPWEIPAGKLLYGHGVTEAAPAWLSVAPMGMCILEDM